MRNENSVTLHETVVSEIMAYLPPKSLLACRLVDRTWNRAAAPHLRKRATSDLSSVNISAAGSGEGLMSNVKLNLSGCHQQNQLVTHGLINFLNEWGGNIKHLKVSVSINTVSTCLSLLKCLPLLNKLSLQFSINSDWISYDDTHFKKVEAHEHALALRAIQIDFQSYNETVYQNGSVGYFFLEILRLLVNAAPNLEALKVCNTPLFNWSFLLEDELHMFIFNLAILEPYLIKNCPNLSKLHLQSDFLNFRPRDMILLRRLKFSLKELVLPRFNVPPSECRDFMVDFINMLEKRRSELQFIEFTIPTVPNSWPSRPQLFIEFSPFPNLSKLTLSINFETKSDVSILVFDKIDYAITFPVLKELTLNIGCAEYGKRKNVFKRRFQILNAFFPIDGQEFKNLQFLTVHVPHPNTILRKSELQLLTISWRISRMFPNVHNNCAINACRRLNMLGNAA